MAVPTRHLWKIPKSASILNADYKFSCNVEFSCWLHNWAETQPNLALLSPATNSLAEWGKVLPSVSLQWFTRFLMWSSKKERKKELNLCSWYHSAFSTPVVKLWLLSRLKKSPEAENQGESLLSWIISSHFSSGSAKNNSGIAFFEHSYSLLAGTEKVRRMKVSSSEGEGVTAHSLLLWVWMRFVWVFHFDLNLINFLSAFLPFSP